MNSLLPEDASIPAVLHELRTWTGAIAGWTRILHLHRSTDEIERAIRAIERSSAAMERFIGDLSVLSRGAGSPFGLYIEDMNLVAVVEAALDVVRPKAELKNVGLAWTAAGDWAPVVRGDQLRVQQIVCNLLFNALQFTPRDGRIEVTLTTAARTARITVEDSGPGISRAFLPALFQPFSQDPEVHHTDGSGLGLAIAKTLAELQSGSLDVDPGGSGRGATFHVHLPLAPPGAMAAHP
ncbi:MAG: HAMP domain-containing sensor histidine kinase [Vicinamibacterales bacterium]